MSELSSDPPRTDTSAASADAAEHRRVPKWLVLAVVCVGQFMVILDVSIVVVALPSMQRDLGFSTAQIQWVVNAYALTFGGFLLLGGRAADLFGRRRVFLFGLGLFCAASLVCGLAQNQAMLIGARALQGVGGAVLSPATLTILTTVFTDHRERSHALGIWSATAAIGGASGALFGGILTDLLSWRWIFYINIPIGIATIVAARLVLQETRASEARRSLDIAGSVTVTAALGALVYAVAGTDERSWTSPITVGALCASVVLFAVFVLVETRWAQIPMVPFSLFRSRALSVANLTMFLVGGAMFSMWLFLSLYLQDVLHFSALATGLGFLPQTAAIAVAAQISSRLVPRFGPRLPLMLGTSLSTIGLFWLAHVQPTGTYASNVLGGSVLATFGMGMSFTPLAFSATAGVAPQNAGLASGVLNTSRQVGGAIFLAALATIAAARTRAVASSSALHTNHNAALSAGYGRAFAVAGTVAFLGALCALALPGALHRSAQTQPTPAEASTS